MRTKPQTRNKLGTLQPTDEILNILQLIINCEHVRADSLGTRFTVLKEGIISKTNDILSKINILAHCTIGNTHTLHSKKFYNYCTHT